MFLSFRLYILRTLPTTFLVPFLALNLLQNDLLANEQYRPTHPSQLPLGTVVDQGFRVKTAKVVVFNRMALERDFTFLKGRSNAEIENWILDNFAYVNSLQLLFSGIRNTEISIDRNQRKDLYIPPGVGRGADIAVSGHPGLVSIKANGNSSWNKDQVTRLANEARQSLQMLEKVRGESHSSGLEPFFIAAAEYLRQLEIQHDYDNRNPLGKTNYQTVESYFLLDMGFNVIYPNEKFRAFVYGRQAHFGRTAGNYPIQDEIYTDKGEFQETYTRSRVDFGGTRTSSEALLAYHEKFKKLSPEEIADFIRAKELHFQRTRIGKMKESIPDLITATAARANLESDFFRSNSKPMPAAIGLSPFDTMDKDWLIDTPDLAYIKWTLFQLSGERLKSYLNQIGDEALTRLFWQAEKHFQLPLPKAVYEFGFKKLAVRSSAIAAASHVFTRFPEFVKPSVKMALDELFAEKSYWQPPEIASLIAVETEFPGFEEFLLKVVESKNHGSKVDVIERLWRERENKDRAKRVIDRLLQLETSASVIQDVELRFPELIRAVRCQATFSR